MASYFTSSTLLIFLRCFAICFCDAGACLHSSLSLPSFVLMSTRCQCQRAAVCGMESLCLRIATFCSAHQGSNIYSVLQRRRVRGVSWTHCLEKHCLTCVSPSYSLVLGGNQISCGSNSATAQQRCSSAHVVFRAFLPIWPSLRRLFAMCMCAMRSLHDC